MLLPEAAKFWLYSSSRGTGSVSWLSMLEDDGSDSGLMFSPVLLPRLGIWPDPVTLTMDDLVVEP